MNEKLVILILYVAGGLLLALLSLPLHRDKIHPNAWYGFRVPKTLNNPEVWYAANRYTAKRLLVAGISMVLSAVFLYLFLPGLSVDAYALAGLAVFVLVFGAGLVQSILYLRKL